MSADAAIQPSPRPEREIFAELGKLCAQPGYVHAIAAFCFRDNVVAFGDTLSGPDLLHMHSRSRLIRTELTTLIGLLVREPIDFHYPGAKTVQSYMDETENHLRELHDFMNHEAFPNLASEILSGDQTALFTRGVALREPIFYGGESAYSFQYRELAVPKYNKDNAWLKERYGFFVEDAQSIVRAIGSLQGRKLFEHVESFRKISPENWVLLPGLCFSAEEIADESGVDAGIVASVLNIFTLNSNDRNTQFESLQDFNIINSRPLIPVSDGQYLNFQIYSLTEALYEGPFYWMLADKAYKAEALKNRGEFTEEISRQFLERVFGSTNVHRGVIIPSKKGQQRGEIDVLVLFGDQAIVVQAKSKRLTLPARKGNDQVLKDDFKKAIQESCDQAMDCAAALLEDGCRLEDSEGNAILLKMPVRQIFPICVVADHYPALNFQARQFLQFECPGKVAPPLISDVFALDIMSEMLSSPLRFLSYLNLRGQFADRVHMSHELTLLGYHLKRNLWLTENVGFLTLEDDISADLDSAMLVRREGLPGDRTPPGVLTRLKGTLVDQLLSDIESSPDPAKISFGLFLLELSEDTARAISDTIAHISEQTRSDMLDHDATFGVGERGVIFHTNYFSPDEAYKHLSDHCHRRKYKLKARQWFGLSLNPGNQKVRMGIVLDFPWIQDSEMDAKVARLPMPSGNLKKPMKAKAIKVGRNDPCSCGSGLKFKKCCL